MGCLWELISCFILNLTSQFSPLLLNLNLSPGNLLVCLHYLVPDLNGQL